MRRIYTVGQVNRYIRGLFTGDGMLSSILVRGEVSNCKYHSSGHIYFSIKDQTGTLSCIMFAGNRRGLSFRMKDGDKVVVGGNVDVYERDGRYQLYAREIQLEGEGLLYERFLRLKRELEEQGLFDPVYKKPIPRYAARIGIVTAPTGAAVRDIENIASRRNPYVQLILYPALVQGEGAKESIVKGIKALDGLVDVIIVGRGGGSYEDLWAFNEEVVARAIFACMTPVISAVGHETDTTISDLAADLRAPTPSAAAELAVFEYRAFEEDLQFRKHRFSEGLERKIQLARGRAKLYEARFSARSAERLLTDGRRRSADLARAFEEILSERLLEAVRHSDEIAKRARKDLEEILIRARHKLALYAAAFDGRSPLKRLSSGYSYTEDGTGRAVTSVEGIKKDDPLFVHVTDGTIEASVVRTEKIVREMNAKEQSRGRQ